MKTVYLHKVMSELKLYWQSLSRGVLMQNDEKYFFAVDEIPKITTHKIEVKNYEEIHDSESDFYKYYAEEHAKLDVSIEELEEAAKELELDDIKKLKCFNEYSSNDEYMRIRSEVLSRYLEQKIWNRYPDLSQRIHVKLENYIAYEFEKLYIARKNGSKDKRPFWIQFRFRSAEYLNKVTLFFNVYFR